MMKFFFRLTVWIVLFLGISSCQNKEVPLDEAQFTALLLDMHKMDAILAINKEYARDNDLKNYAYYNELFKKNEITRADFDSCMHYYSEQIDMFSKMYDVIIDSLNKDLTTADKILNKLKANDSINYFPMRIDTIRLDSVPTVTINAVLADSAYAVTFDTTRLDWAYIVNPDAIFFDSSYVLRNDTIYTDSVYIVTLDTIRLDSVYTVKIDSILPGLYKFNTKLQFDSESKNNYRRISSFFTSADGKDTLRVRHIVVRPDTLERTYNWSQYIDSVYTQLVIQYMEEVPLKDRPKIYKNRKWIQPSKKEKAINLEEFGGKAFENEIFRTYISRKTEKSLKEGLERQR